jgi:hypothetical protein
VVWLLRRVAVHRDQEFAVAQQAQQVRIGGVFVDRPQQGGLELRAQDRGTLQRAPRRRRQAVDTRQQQAFEG